MRILGAGGAVMGLTAACLLLLLVSGCNKSNDQKSLTFFCAAGIRRPVEAAAKQYEEEYGIQIQLQYGGSGTLLSNIQAASIGDLYLAADDSYIEKAREKGLLAEAIPLASQRIVIAVQKDNPKNILSIDDLLKKDIQVALGNPGQAAIGRVCKKALTKTGQWEALEKHARVFKPTVNEVANDIKLGTVDAGVIWDATANQYDELDLVRVPAFEGEVKHITVGVLTSSKFPTEALKFARYLGARDKGLMEFKNFGYEPVQGDKWSEKPEILIYSGAMLRPGLESVIKRFEQREGVTFNMVYNGCGILVAQMKAGEKPAAYLACDLSFMKDVRDRFRDAIILTENDMVILVPKGNKKNVLSLKDLTKKGLKVGVAHEQNSALGSLTAKLLREADLYDAVAENKVTDSATGDYLINQVVAGSLDAAIVYRSNAKANPDNLKKHYDIVEINHPNAYAVQPIAIAKETPYRYVLERFFDAVRSEQSKKEFESFGFRWRGDDSGDNDEAGP